MAHWETFLLAPPDDNSLGGLLPSPVRSETQECYQGQRFGSNQKYVEP